MLLYLDLNCFNRPFDDQTQERIARETAAVFAVLERVDAASTSWLGRRCWPLRTRGTPCLIAGADRSLGTLCQ